MILTNKCITNTLDRCSLKQSQEYQKHLMHYQNIKTSSTQWRLHTPSLHLPAQI